MDLLSEGMLRWWKRNITRILIKHLNRTWLAWRDKLKGVGNIWWDKETRTYKPEGEGRSVYPRHIGGSREDEDVVAGRYCIIRAMH